MAAPCARRRSFNTMCRILSVVSQRITLSGFHTNSNNLMRKRRGVSTGKLLSQTDYESRAQAASRFQLPREVDGTSDDRPPELPGRNSEESRQFRGKTASAAENTKSMDDESQPEMSSRYGKDIRAVIPKYSKAGPDDKRLGRASMLAKSRKHREQSGKIILEGRRLITDALESGAKADTIFFSQVSNIEGLPLSGSKVNLVKVAYKDIALWSDVHTPQGIVGVFRKPNYENLSLDETDILPVSLICDNIRDPGNLGTILRSAAAAACNKIILTKGCVDVWEPKVLRSGAGAHFRVPIIANVPWTSIPNYLPPHQSVHIADCNNDHFSMLDANDDGLSENGDAAMNSQWDRYPEAQGHEREHNTDSNHTEFQIRRQPLHDNDLPVNRHGVVTEPLDHAEDYRVDEDVHSEEMNAPTSPRTVPYYHVTWAKGDCALVIGGETEGLSAEAQDLCVRTGGRRISIPMSMGIDSLNAAMATSVILFEAKRQFLIAS